MENWCYDEQTLLSFAKHHSTGETLPRHLFDKIVKAKTFQSGLQMLRQLYFGAVDMCLHSELRPMMMSADVSSALFQTHDHEHGDGAVVIREDVLSDVMLSESPFAVQQRMAKMYTVLPPLAEDRFLCSFMHIFGGGYAAGYYSYKWAEVMSADAFAAFEPALAHGDEAAVRAAGRRFRDTVLALGGGTDPRDVFRMFRGRDPSVDALLRHSGLMMMMEAKE